MIRIALQAATGDPNGFAYYLKTHSLDSLDQLLDEGSRQRHLTLSVLSVLGDIEAKIAPSMRGDLLDARELTRPALAIVGENWRETLALREHRRG